MTRALTFAEITDLLGKDGAGRDPSVDHATPEGIPLLGFRYPDTGQVAYVYGDDLDAPRVIGVDHESDEPTQWFEGAQLAVLSDQGDDEDAIIEDESGSDDE